MAGPVRPPAVGLGAAPSCPARRPLHAVAHQHQHQQGGRRPGGGGTAAGAGGTAAASLPCARRFTARRSGRRRTVAAYATIPVPPSPPDGAAPRHQQQHALEVDPPLLTGGAPASGAVGPDLGWRLDFSESYIRGKLLGQGSFGAVYLGIDLRNGQEVAIKVMPKVRGKLTRQRTCEKLLKEASILAALQDCPGAVRLLGCYEQGDEVMVVTELCSGGDLQRLSDEAGALAERGAALVMYEALKVVKCCHDRGVLHGDVKPANFVLKHATRNPLRAPGDLDLLFTPWLRAIDFGCSQYVREERFGKRTGTPVYMAPEVFARDYGLEADIWSAGIMLYQLYARRFPYWETYEACRAARLEEVAALVAAGAVPLDYGPWRRMTPEGLDFVRSCLTHDHVDRMTVDEALDHAWFDAWLPSEGELAAAREQQAVAAAAAGAGANGGGQGQQQQQVAAAASLSAPLTPQQRLAASHDAQASMRASERERASVVLPAFSSSSSSPAQTPAPAPPAPAAPLSSPSSSSPGPSAPAPGVSSSSVETPFPAGPAPALSGAVARAYANGSGRAPPSAAPRPPPPAPRDLSTPPPPASPEPSSSSVAGARAGMLPGVVLGGGAGGGGPLQAVSASSGGGGGGGGSLALGPPPASASAAAAAAQQALRGVLSWGAAAMAGARRAVTAQLEASAAMGGEAAPPEGDGDSSRQQQQQQQQQ